MDAEQRSVFQGIVYYYRENMVNCRYQVTLKDAVDGALLQQALDAARAKAPYYFQKPVWEKKLLHLSRRTATDVSKTDEEKSFLCFAHIFFIFLFLFAHLPLLPTAARPTADMRAFIYKVLIFRKDECLHRASRSLFSEHQLSLMAH